MTSLCHLELAKLLNMPKIAGSFLAKDHFLLTILACVVGAIGFMHDDNSLILGSMLISPFEENAIAQSMLSILLGNYKGTISGMLSLIVLAVVGISIGFVMAEFNRYFDHYYIIPSKNMKKLASYKFLITNLVVSIVSGFFLSYAMINQNMAVLHGIALIITILPSLVNSGLYFSLARYNKGKNNDLYLEYKKNSINSFVIAFINTCGVSISVLIGFLVFCSN
jgi:hypothetical protein